MKDRTKLPIEFFERDGHVWAVCSIETCDFPPHKFVALTNPNINGRVVALVITHAMEHK